MGLTITYSAALVSQWLQLTLCKYVFWKLTFCMYLYTAKVLTRANLCMHAHLTTYSNSRQERQIKNQQTAKFLPTEVTHGRRHKVFLINGLPGQTLSIHLNTLHSTAYLYSTIKKIANSNTSITAHTKRAPFTINVKISFRFQVTWPIWNACSQWCKTKGTYQS